MVGDHARGRCAPGASVTLGRVISITTPGVSPLFFRYQLVGLSEGQQAFIATPEKALLDLAHLTPHSDSPNYLAELRLLAMPANLHRTGPLTL